MNRINKFLILMVLVVMSMSVAMAADVSDDTDDVVLQSIETTQEATQDVATTKFKNELNIENSDQQSVNTHILNTSSFKEYVTDGKFNEKVSDGDTIDIQGKLDSPKFALEIDKAVNIISSTGDAYIDFDTHSVGSSGDYTNGIFQVTSGGAGSNITGITFHNTRVTISSTNNIRINNISVICESNTGFGVGSFTIRDHSENISISNSYFKTTSDNGGHSNVVFAGVRNVLFENNTVIAESDGSVVGNLVYITTYNSDSGDSGNITIRNNTICSYIPEWSKIATCMGLVLSGSGHLVENNYISARYAVNLQYADSDYNFSTNIGEIIFRNNYVEDPLNNTFLQFPGQVYNNTFKNRVYISKAHTYNNTFEKVELGDSNIFENNTANQVLIKGNNNIISDNFVSSNKEDTIKNTGENNTILNNHNIFYIDDNNIDNYFVDQSEMFGYPDYYWYKVFYIKENVFEDDDILIFNVTCPMDLYEDYSTHLNLTIISLNDMVISSYLLGEITIKDSLIPAGFLRAGEDSRLNLINSTIITHQQYRTPVNVDNSIVISDYPINNTYILHIYPEHIYIGSILNNGYLDSNVNNSGDVIVYTYDSRFEKQYNDMYLSDYYKYYDDIYINKQLNWYGVPIYGIIGSNVHLIEGSAYSTFTGITFNNDVIIESDSIKFENCTFNKDVILKGYSIIFERNIFKGNINLDSTINVVFNNNTICSEDSINILNTRNAIFENNTVTTTADNTIVFDDASSNNIVRNNKLVANVLVGDDSVIGGENTVEDNTPSYDTQIIIDAEDQAYLDEDLEVTITVNDLNNSKPVSKGYVEVYYNGYLIDITDLTDGTASVSIPVAEYIDGSDSYPLKVWYYNGKRYNNNITTKNIKPIKSNVTITVDEFTAKLNEKATITTTFLNEKGNQVQDTNVTFSIGRSSFTVETVDGVATLDEIVTKEWLDSGKLTVSFPSTDAYNSNTTTVTLNTTKDDVTVTPDVTVDGAIANIKLTLTDSLNNPVTDGRVSIKTLDGSSELASGRVTSGVYTTTVTLPEDYTEEYLLASYTGSYYYDDFERNVKITQMLNSTITLKTNSPLVGEELEITGKLVDSKDNPIKEENVTITTDNDKTSVTTDDNGEFTYTYTPVLGVNNITVSYGGSPDVYGTSVEKTVTVRDTDRDMNDVLNQLEQLQDENRKLQEQLAALIAALTSPEDSVISVDFVGVVKYNDNVTIRGVLSSESGVALSNQVVNVSVNGVSSDVKVVNGVFEYGMIVKDIGEQNVTVSFAGNSKYAASSVSSSFYVQKKPVLYFYATDNTTEDSAVAVSGKLLNNGKAIKAATITLNVNGKDVTVTPNKDGYFTYKFKAIAGENVVTATYDGTEEYAATEATTTIYAQMKTTLYAYKIENANTQDTIKVSGKLLNKGKAIVGETVTILINGQKYTATTNKDGYFQINIKVANVGENNLTVTYVGSEEYIAAEYTSTFTTKNKTKVYTYKLADTTVGKTSKISGKLLSGNEAIANKEVTITVDGTEYTATTNKEGYFQFDYKAVKTGTLNVTVTYKGDDEYYTANYNTTLTVNA